MRNKKLMWVLFGFSSMAFCSENKPYDVDNLEQFALYERDAQSLGGWKPFEKQKNLEIFASPVFIEKDGTQNAYFKYFFKNGQSGLTLEYIYTEECKSGKGFSRNLGFIRNDGKYAKPSNFSFDLKGKRSGDIKALYICQKMNKKK